MRSCNLLDVHQATYARYTKDMASCARIGIYRKAVGRADDVGKIVSYNIYGTRKAIYVVHRRDPAPSGDFLLLDMLGSDRYRSRFVVSRGFCNAVSKQVATVSMCSAYLIAYLRRQADVR